MTAAFWSPPVMSWSRLRWPREVPADEIEAALLAMNGLSTPRRRQPLILRAVGHAGEVQHHVGVPEDRQHLLAEQLRAAIPGLGLEVVAAALVPTARAWQ